MLNLCINVRKSACPCLPLNSPNLTARGENSGLDSVLLPVSLPLSPFPLPPSLPLSLPPLSLSHCVRACDIIFIYKIFM